MKKGIIILVLLAMLTLHISAQSQDVEMFVKTVPIYKIYSHSLGYKVFYTKTDMSLGEFNVPHTWFVAGGRGEVVFGRDPSYPYFSVFWKDGKFSFIRLFLWEDFSHITWGLLKTGPEVNAQFEVEDLNIDF